MTINREQLARKVADAFKSEDERREELRPLVVRLRDEFDRLKDGETIMGHRKWTEFCPAVLKRTVRTIQYWLSPSGKNVKRGKSETVSHKAVAKKADPPLKLTAADKRKLVDSALESHRLVEAIRNGGDVTTAVKELQKNLLPKDRLQALAHNAARALKSDNGVQTTALRTATNAPSEIGPSLVDETLSVLTEVSRQLQQGELAVRVRGLLNNLSGCTHGPCVPPQPVKKEVIPPANKKPELLNWQAPLESAPPASKAMAAS